MRQNRHQGNGGVMKMWHQGVKGVKGNKGKRVKSRSDNLLVKN